MTFGEVRTQLADNLLGVTVIHPNEKVEREVKCNSSTDLDKYNGLEMVSNCISLSTGDAPIEVELQASSIF